jgi:protocatechuate 3,4-dioxygenase beta subunit
MQRRSFIQTAAWGAVAVSVSGFVRFDGKSYVGDCETTSDIIGPFYRPDSPVRNNLIIKDDPGTPVELSGFIKHNDCLTPYQKAKIELWHCDSKGVYDNTSPEYRHRGTSYSDESGHYHFDTILPVPYDVGGTKRPAHFHLMITAAGYMPLVTQLYFTGDPWISKDPSSRSPAAKKRILEVQTAQDGRKKVVYDVILAEKLAVESASLDRLTGSYVCEKDKTITCEFFKRNHTLWYNASYGKKLDPYGMDLEFVGNNTFRSPSLPSDIRNEFVFEVLNTGAIKCTEKYLGDFGQSGEIVFLKVSV